MFVKVLLFFALAFAVTHADTTLKCYNCMGSKDSDCYGNDKSAFVVNTCKGYDNLINKDLGLPQLDSSADTIKVQCVKVTVKPSQGYETPYFLRACGETYDNNTNVCELIQQVVPIENCEWCDDRNLCNDY